MNISNRMIGFAKVCAIEPTESSANDKLLQLFKDKICHTIDKWIKNRKFYELKQIREAAAYNSPSIGEKWRQIGLFDQFGKFMHDYIRSALLSHRITKEEVILAVYNSSSVGPMFEL
eukprot:NODE_403_length_9316_cov_0.901269.p4 type:complete len:117 gc:universal NODE_403_length_9316_cov_0.901269:2360-2710(+)